MIQQGNCWSFLPKSNLCDLKMKTYVIVNEARLISALSNRNSFSSQRTLTMFLGVVALRYPQNGDDDRLNQLMFYYLFQAHGLANYCASKDPTDERYRLVYEIEESYYGGKHPLTYDEHQTLTNEHKQLLEDYREEIRTIFYTLEEESKTLDVNDVFSAENLSKARTFSEHVFEGSKETSNGLLKVSNCIISSSVETLKRVGISAPCKFAVIALGSIAKGEATPYSDLEYGIIVEQESKYFQKLAVDSYFRIGNLGETSLKSFDIAELKVPIDKSTADGCRIRGLQDFRQTIGGDDAVGYRIDGITMWSGNIPTGNGISRENTLTLTVDGFMKLYKEEAEKRFVQLADKSDLLSSSVVIYTNEGENSKLHESFLEARRGYEFSNASNNDTVTMKRYNLFRSDMKSYTFLPEFVSFKPPINLSIKVKTEIFRYSTLLANNIKMCSGFETRYPWDTYSKLRSADVLSEENHQYLNAVLALSIYMRTSAYLRRGSQTESVTLDPEFVENRKSQYRIPHDIFIMLGCLLTPIKKAINEVVLKEFKGRVSLNDVVAEMIQNIRIAREDFLPKIEAQYFCGQYYNALKNLDTMFNTSIATLHFSDFKDLLRCYYLPDDESQGCSDHLSINLRESDSKQKQILELCSYLLYYTKNYKRAADYFSWLVSVQEEQTGLWKLLAAHCNKEKGDYQTAKQFLDEVCFRNFKNC